MFFNDQDSSGSRQDSATRATAHTLMRFLRLYIEDTRLNIAEKLTLLFSAVAFFALVIILGVVALVFISIGVGHLLASTIAPVWAYIYIAAFYVLLFILLIIFRKALLEDPIARFISRLIVKEPEPETPKSEKSHEIDKPVS